MSEDVCPPSRGNDPNPETGPWTDRVKFSETSEGLPVAYRPHEVITTRGSEALEVAQELYEGAELVEEVGPFSLLIGIGDPILLVEELRLRGIVAQPNHVYFAHGANPVYGYGANPVYGYDANPVYGYPVYGYGGRPVYGYPVYGYGGRPVYGYPANGHPEYGFSGKPGLRAHTAPDRSSALPPPRHTETSDIAARVGTNRAAGSPHVIVLDTGLAAVGFRPAGLGNGITAATGTDVDHPDEDTDTYLDPIAGHGTFIAGVIAQIAPGCEITLHRVLKTAGDGDEWEIGKRIRHLVTPEPERTILSLSFGGYTLDDPPFLGWVIRRIQHRGVTVVASAGNDGTGRPSFPAAFPEVIGVGALSPDGPAWFTNYGDWVDACAPGTDLISTFFENFNGPAPVGPYGDDPDDFRGWAQWSGTSFSAPVVVGNLARMLMTGTPTGAEAVKRLIAADSLTTIPGLGTVVDFL